MARRQRGFSLVECMIALALLALVLTTSLVVLERKRAFLADVTERLHAQHAIEKELEVGRARPFALLVPGFEGPFVSDASELARLPGASATLTVAATDQPGLLRLHARVTWGVKRKKELAGETLVAASEWR